MTATLTQQQVNTPVTSRPRWRHVPQVRGPIARPSHPGAPGGRPTAGAAPLVRTHRPPVVAQPTWQLTRRGLKVAMALFLGMLTLATVTLVTAFFTVSNDPVTRVGAPPAAISQG